MNYCITAAWQRDDLPVALLRGYGSPGCFDSDLQLVYILGSGDFYCPLDNIVCGVQVRQVGWPIKYSKKMVCKPVTSSFGTVGRCQVLLEKEIDLSIDRSMANSKIFW